MLHKSEQIDTLAAALVKAQAKFTGAARSATNPHLKNRYATLGDTWDACRDALHANGLTVVQTFDAQDDAGIVLVTTLLHTSGQWISSALRMPLEKPSAQAVGSATTYARRYGLAALVGVVVDDDDDGTAAANHAPAQARTPAIRSEPAPARPANAAPAPAAATPLCPQCDGPMWDNRQDKRNPKAPDFKCKDKSCGEGVWLDSFPKKPAAAAGRAFDQVPDALLDEGDDLPFDR